LERTGLTVTDDPLTLTQAIAASTALPLFKKEGPITRLLDLLADQIDDTRLVRDEPWFWPAQGYVAAQGRTWQLSDQSSWPITLNQGGTSYVETWFTTSDEEDFPEEARHQAVCLTSLASTQQRLTRSLPSGPGRLHLVS